MDAIAAAAGMASPMPLTIVTNLTPASGKPPKSTAKSKGKAKPDSADKGRIKRDAWKACLSNVARGVGLVSASLVWSEVCTNFTATDSLWRLEKKSSAGSAKY